MCPSINVILDFCARGSPELAGVSLSGLTPRPGAALSHHLRGSERRDIWEARCPPGHRLPPVVR